MWNDQIERELEVGPINHHARARDGFNCAPTTRQEELGICALGLEIGSSASVPNGE